MRDVRQPQALEFPEPSPQAVPEQPEPSLASLRVLFLGLSATTERALAAVIEDRLPLLARAELDGVQPAMLSPERYDLIVLEDREAEGSYAESLWAWLAKQGLPFLILSGQPDDRRAARALRAGACGFLGLPTSWKELEGVLLRVAWGEGSGAKLTLSPATEPAIWEDPAMVALGEEARRVALTRSTVLVRGEPGVGKSRLARQIHSESNRAARPWIEVDADSDSEEALDLVLFGTSPSMPGFAERPVPGALEQARGGTLYIREIARLPIALQVRLLRALERGELPRTGHSLPTSLDVRVMASSSEDLAEAVAEGRLREDLYYELSTVELFAPPLRERPLDIEALAKHVLREQNQRYGTRTRWSPEALELLKGLPWEGNARELRRFAQRCFVWSDGPNELSLAMVQKQFERLGLAARGGAASAATIAAVEDRVVVSVGESIPEAERKLIEATLERFEGDKRHAAKTLGISLKTLYTRLQRYKANETN